jgi:hypothetical protein
MSAREDIFNSVISLFKGLLDESQETQEILVIRRYEDAPRPSNSLDGSCDNYSKSVYGELSLDSIEPEKICRGSYVDDCGQSIACVTKQSIVKMTIDFIGCGAFDVAEYISCNIELADLRARFMPDYISYYRHGNIVDVTALEEARHTERVTFELEFIYSCSVETEKPFIEINDTLTTNECGDTHLIIETNIN